MSKAKLATVKEELAEVSDPPKLAITASDIEIPRLNIIQSSSEIAGDAGSVVLDRTTTILEPDKECQVIPVNALKGWRENVPFGSPEMPRIAWNEEEKKEIESDSEFGTIEFANLALLIFSYCLIFLFSYESVNRVSEVLIISASSRSARKLSEFSFLVPLSDFLPTRSAIFFIGKEDTLNKSSAVTP